MLPIILALVNFVCQCEHVKVYVADYVMRVLRNHDRKFNLYHAGVIVETETRKFLFELGAKHLHDVFRVMFPIDSGNLDFLISGQLHWDNPAELQITDLTTDQLPEEYEAGYFYLAMTLEEISDPVSDYVVAVTERWADQDFDLFNVASLSHDRKFLSSHLCHDLVEWTLQFFAARGGRFQASHVVRDELLVYGASVTKADFSNFSQRLKLLQYLAFLAVNSDYAGRSFGEARDLFVKPKLLGAHYPVGNGKDLFWVDVAQGGLELCYVSYNATFHRTGRVCMMNSTADGITADLRFVERLIFLDQVAWAMMGVALTAVMMAILRFTRVNHQQVILLEKKNN